MSTEIVRSVSNGHFARVCRAQAFSVSIGRIRWRIPQPQQRAPGSAPNWWARWSNGSGTVWLPLQTNPTSESRWKFPFDPGQILRDVRRVSALNRHVQSLPSLRLASSDIPVPLCAELVAGEVRPAEAKTASLFRSRECGTCLVQTSQPRASKRCAGLWVQL